MKSEKFLLITDRKTKLLKRKYICVKKYTSRKSLFNDILSKQYGLIVLILNEKKYQQIAKYGRKIDLGCGGTILILATKQNWKYFKFNKRFICFDKAICRGGLISNTKKMFRFFIQFYGQPYRFRRLLLVYAKYYYFYNRDQIRKSLLRKRRELKPRVIKAFVGGDYGY